MLPVTVVSDKVCVEKKRGLVFTVASDMCVIAFDTSPNLSMTNSCVCLCMYTCRFCCANSSQGLTVETDYKCFDEAD